MITSIGSTQQNLPILMPAGHLNAFMGGGLGDVDMALQGTNNLVALSQQVVPQIQQASQLYQAQQQQGQFLQQQLAQQQALTQQYQQQLLQLQQGHRSQASSISSESTATSQTVAPTNTTSSGELRANIGQPKAKGKPYLRLVATNQKDEHGNIRMKLQNIDAQGKVIGELAAVSGAPGKQDLGALTKVAQSNAPVPEGVFSVGAGVASGEPGIGRLFFPVEGTPGRSAIGVHLDANRSTSPGTAGCIGLLSEADLATFEQWMKADNHPKEIEVNYGSGTVS
ncbi:MAG: hypothetical protein ACKO34_09290 [Vampirovibrionales bacterium]